MSCHGNVMVEANFRLDTSIFLVHAHFNFADDYVFVFTEPDASAPDEPKEITTKPCKLKIMLEYIGFVFHMSHQCMRVAILIGLVFNFSALCYSYRSAGCADGADCQWCQ